MNSDSDSTDSNSEPVFPLDYFITKKSQISVLFVFKSHNNAQCTAFSRAAEKLKYPSAIVQSIEDIAEKYKTCYYDVVIVDSRPGSGIDPLECSKAIHSSKYSEGSLLVAVRPQVLTEADSNKMMQMIKAGYSRQFLENTNPVVCLNELQTLHYGHVDVMVYKRTCNLLAEIIDNVNDAVEVMDNQFKIQYVNTSSELVTGMDCEDIRDKLYWEHLVEADDDLFLKNVTNSHLTRRLSMFYSKRSGDKVSRSVSYLPIANQYGKLENLVAIHNPTTSSTHMPQQQHHQQHHVNQHPQLTETSSLPTTGDVKIKTRKESVVRLPSMSIEAPITKVINMITNLQDSCDDEVSDSLDQVLDVLRSSELYAPYFNEQVKGDKFTIELVGGLMTKDKDAWNTRRISLSKRPSCSLEQPVLSKSSLHTTSHSHSVKPDIENLLDDEENWEFDIIKLEGLTMFKPLYYLGMRTMQRYEVTEFLQIDDLILSNWLQLMEGNYHQSNPYHNSTHAADVMHATAYFLSCDQVKTIFDHIDEVACLIAAAVHDLDHPGKTNSYLVNSNADLAFLYNDLAVLESHHVSLAYRLTLKNEDTNIFKNLNRDNFKQLRQQIIDMVLATEMTKHFEHLNRFVSVINQTSLHDCKDNASQSEALMKLSTVDNRVLVKRMLIKCADVSNPARPLSLCKEWAVRIAKEYCNQTDEEKSRGLPVVMPVFDSKSCNVPKSQTSFIDLFINDMYDTWTNFCSLPDMRKCIKENYRYWKDQERLALEQQQQQLKQQQQLQQQQQVQQQHQQHTPQQPQKQQQ